MTDLPAVDQSDFDALLELLQRESMTDVVRIFVGSAPTRLSAARDGLASGDSLGASTAFHTLRSGCGQLGARRLEELAASAERLSKHGDIAGAAAQLGAVEAEFARCVAWFRENGWIVE